MGTTVAILDDPKRVESELGKLDDLDIVWKGLSVEALMDVLPELKPQVLVLKLDNLGPTPMTRAQILSTMGKSSLTIATYSFARPYVLDALREASVVPVQEPLVADRLRALVTEHIGKPDIQPADKPADEAKPDPFDPMRLLGMVSKSA